MENKINLPPCGMFLGVPIYLDRGDYIFQTTGPYFTSWISEDHDPFWYLDQAVADKQGNFVEIWDGGATTRQLLAAAFMEDIEAPAPNWEKGEFLTPADFPAIEENRGNWGAGFYRFVVEAAKRGLWVYSCYIDATPEWARKIAALPNFIGYSAGEAFSMGSGFKEVEVKGAAAPDAWRKWTLDQTAQVFAESIRAYFAKRNSDGWSRIFVTSGTFSLDFEVAHGGNGVIPNIEGYAFQHLNFASAICRGMYKQCGLPLWGLYLAHEHYGNVPLASPRRWESLDAGHYLGYLNGSKIATQESGSWWQQSDHIIDTPMHEVPKFDAGKISINKPHDYAHLVPEARKHYPEIGYNSEPCRQYRRAVAEFYDYIQKNGTPDGQPEVNFAVLKGRNDFCAQTFEPNFPIGGERDLADRDAFWREGPPEYGWEIFRRAILPLNDSFAPYKNLFFSGTPYGLCDIISLAPHDTGVGKLTGEWLAKNYKSLIFAGWNTAKEEDYELLCDYVRRGGKLFISIPQLAKNSGRNYISYSADMLVNGGDFSELAGVKVKGRGDLFYWAMAKKGGNDVYYSLEKFGTTFTHLGDIELTSDVEVLLVEDERFRPFLWRHKLGLGETYFLNSWEYPGTYNWNWASGVKIGDVGFLGELWQYMAKNSRGTVWIEGDTHDICYSYFPSTNAVYMLNCDFAAPHTFTLKTAADSREITLAPHEFKVVKL